MIGLWAYFSIAWYVATLVSTVVSMLIVVIGTLIFPKPCDWRRIAGADHTQPDNG